jgi:phenylacetate-CoA ligase
MVYSDWMEELLYKSFLYKLNLHSKGISNKLLETYYDRDLLTQKQIAEIQNEKLREFLKYCNINSPYYHNKFLEHDLNLNAADMILELRKIPAISKKEIRENLESIFSREYLNRKGLIAKFTGGSTGTPLEIWGNYEDYRETM